MNHHYVVIMAGGIGSRFWPVSRTDYPKQFLDILGTGQTLIQQTFRRFEKLVPAGNIYVVTSADYTDIVAEQLPAIPRENILGEPERRNTAPCILYISNKLIKKDPEACMIVAPSDHLILEESRFVDVCRAAFSFAEKQNVLVTLGIKPSYPNTGYGYISYEPEPVRENVYKVAGFKEKPDLELARQYIAAASFLWNAGIFVWRVDAILAAAGKHLPLLFDLFKERHHAFNTPNESSALNEIFARCADISIDFGVMEKAGNVYVIPSSFGWSDLGTWNSAWEVMPKDYAENALAGEGIMVIDSTNCVVHARDEKVVVLQGLDNYIVADTEDVLLICQKNKEQQIKDYVSKVKSTKGERYLYSPSFQYFYENKIGPVY